MKQIMLMVLMTITTVLWAAPPEVTNVRASQREGTKLIDLWYDVADTDGDLLKVRIEVSDNNGAKWSIPAFTFTGDVGDGIAPGANKHVVWDAGIDWDGEYSDQMRIKVFAVDAKGYPGLEWGDEVLPGGFLLGQDGGAEGSGPCRHVNIPWSYWLSKYEITVGQYCDFLNTAYAAGKVMRSNGYALSVADTELIEHFDESLTLIKIGDEEQIRWNVNKFEVLAGKTNLPVTVSWYGAMAWANFYGYDLPTEAEWEKCARGPDFDDQGEHCLYTWGNDKTNTKANFNNGQYYLVSVGSFAPNGYGCFDMTGNQDEWTRTIYNYYGYAPGTSSSYKTPYDIDNYPQQESLNDARHQPWINYDVYWKCHSMIYKTGMPICKRESNTRVNTCCGFRVCKRYIPEGN